MKTLRLINLTGIIAVILIGVFCLGYYFLIYHKNPNLSQAAEGNSETQTNSQTSSKASRDENPFLGGIDSTTIKSTAVETFEIIIRLFLAVILSGILAFRPRRNVPLFRRNLYVAQTQILLAVVAAALMLIVGDNTARAFAIFAAVSLVRFRTNIRDPKEITVLLLSLALGLATGVGRWDLGLVLCLFALVLLWVLEFNESEQVFRSMELTIKTRNTDVTHDILKKIFQRYQLEGEIRQIDPPDEEKPIGSIVYYLNLRLNIGTDYLSDRILDADSENIEGIQWEQKKSSSNIYQ